MESKNALNSLRNKMNIIHLVLGKANPERMNGVNKVAYQLASTQANLGLNVTLWGIANTLEVNYADRNFETKIFQQYKNKLTLDSNLVAAIKALPTSTIVHIHGAFIPEFYKISRLLKRQNIPYIFTPHGSFTEMAMTKNKWVKQVYFQVFESKVIRDAKRIQLLGINEYDFLDTLTKKARKCLIPNGQDLTVIPMYTKKEQSKVAPVFGFCGRLATFHKGLDLMFEGFQIYLKNGGTGTLELIGDSEERATLEQLAEDLGIADSVIFHGKKFGEAKYNLLHQMDVFLHTSRMEGFPTAVLEAAAMRIPTLTSEATNINDFVKKHNSGFLLLENTPTEIAQLMATAKDYFSKNQLTEMGLRGRKMVEQEFDWKHIAERLVEIYEV